VENAQRPEGPPEESVGRGERATNERAPLPGETSPEASAESPAAPPPAEEGAVETETVDVPALLKRLDTLEGEIGDVRTELEGLASEVRTGHTSRLDGLGLSLGDTNTRLSGLQDRVTQLETADRPDPIDASAVATAEAPTPASELTEPVVVDPALGPIVQLGGVASGSLIHAAGLQYIVVGPIAGGGEDAQIKVRRGEAFTYLGPDTEVQVLGDVAAGDPA